MKKAGRVTYWDSTLHSEPGGFRLESLWCAWSSFGTHPHYKAPGDLRVVLQNGVVTKIGWVRMTPSKWSKIGPRTAKWLIKKVWTNFTFCFSDFIAAFHKQANIRCSIGSILRPISSRDHNAVRTDQKNDFLLIYDFCMVVRIFKVTTPTTFNILNNSIIFGRTEKTNEE